MTLTLAITLLLTGGCAPTRPARIELHGEVDQPAASVVVFFVDGMDYRRMCDLLDRGQLPNIQKRFVEGGVEVDHAVTALPSITYAVSVSLITGRFPGHHGVLGNRWFDPDTLVGRDYASAATYRSVNDDFTCPTIYELLDDVFTVNVQCHTRRGVTRTIDNWALSGIDWFRGDYVAVDRRVGYCIEDVARLARQTGRWPAILYNYFPAVDEVGHRYGSGSPEYAESLRIADAAIGRIMNAMESVGLTDSTYFVLLSDHGHVVTSPGHTFDLPAWLRENRSLRVYEGAIKSADHAARGSGLDRFDAVVINGAFRRLVIHLRGPDGWGSSATRHDALRVVGPPDPTSADALYNLPGVAVVCVPAGPDRVEVFSRTGYATVERRCDGSVKQYRLVPSSFVGDRLDGSRDALGYDADLELASFVAAGWHTSRDWLATTAETDYPDFVPQIAEMFDSPRAGDIVVFAAEGWAFRHSDLGGHGSCVAADMRVPLFVSGPDLAPGGRIGPARLVDVMPTILDLLGQHDRLAETDPIDGTSLVAQLRAADQYRERKRAASTPRPCPRTHSLASCSSRTHQP